MADEAKRRSPVRVGDTMWWAVFGWSQFGRLNNPGGVFSDHLSTLGDEYDEKSRAKAEDLGKDPDNFSLCDWVVFGRANGDAPADPDDLYLAHAETLQQNMGTEHPFEYPAHLMAPVFRQVCEEKNIPLVTLTYVYHWWYDGYAPAQFGRVDEVENQGEHFCSILPDLTDAYLAKRAEVVAEEGEDALGFGDLWGWCYAQEEREEKAEEEREREKQEADSERRAQSQAERERKRQEQAQQMEREAARKRGQAEISARLDAAAEKERAHREEHPEHYQGCGRCRRCTRDGECYTPMHRDDIVCGHDLGEGVIISGTSIMCGGTSRTL